MRLNLRYTVLIALLVAGCGGDGYNGRVTGGDAAPAGTIAFTPFVKAQVAKTLDTTEPTEVNDLTFGFDDNDNETAFDDVLQQ